MPVLENPAAFTYIGQPLSSGGSHKLGRMRRSLALEKTRFFFDTCTEPVGGLDYSLVFHDVPELDPHPELARAIDQFGVHADRPGPAARRVTVAAHRVDEVIEFLDTIDPQPTNRYRMAPIWFFVGTKFRIRDPRSGNVIPGQEPEHFGGVEYEWRVPLGTSGLRLILSNTVSVSMELCIPNADPNVLDRVAPWLEEHLPFAFSPEHWRAWYPTKKGSFRSRRIDPPAKLAKSSDIPRR